MPDKVIIMPDRDEMTKALIGVFDNSHAIQKLYPRICDQLAGQEKVAMGIVMGLTLAIYDYTEGLPSGVSNLVYMYMPNFIEAIVPDEEIRQEALDHHNAVMASETTP